MKTRQELREFFRTGEKPTQEQFWEWLDSFWHKDEEIPYDRVAQLDSFMQEVFSRFEILDDKNTQLRQHFEAFVQDSHNFREFVRIKLEELEQGMRDRDEYLAYLDRDVMRLSTRVEEQDRNIQEIYGILNRIHAILGDAGLL